MYLHIKYQLCTLFLVPYGFLYLNKVQKIGKVIHQNVGTNLIQGTKYEFWKVQPRQSRSEFPDGTCIIRVHLHQILMYIFQCSTISIEKEGTNRVIGTWKIMLQYK